MTENADTDNDDSDAQTIKYADGFCDGCFTPAEIYTGDVFLCEVHAKAYGVIGA